MSLHVNPEYPGFRPPRLLTYVDTKSRALFEYHEELQRIRKMSYRQFQKFKNQGEEKFRFIYNEKIFQQFKKKSPPATPTEWSFGMLFVK